MLDGTRVRGALLGSLENQAWIAEDTATGFGAVAVEGGYAVALCEADRIGVVDLDPALAEVGAMSLNATCGELAQPSIARFGGVTAVAWEDDEAGYLGFLDGDGVEIGIAGLGGKAPWVAATDRGFVSVDGASNVGEWSPDGEEIAHYVHPSGVDLGPLAATRVIADGEEIGFLLVGTGSETVGPHVYTFGILELSVATLR